MVKVALGNIIYCIMVRRSRSENSADAPECLFYASYDSTKEALEWMIGKLEVSVNHLAKLLGCQNSPRDVYGWFWKEYRPSSYNFVHIIELLKMKEDEGIDLNEIAYIDWEENDKHITWKKDVAKRGKRRNLLSQRWGNVPETEGKRKSPLSNSDDEPF